MSDVICAFGWRDLFDEVTDGVPKGIDGSGFGGAQQFLEFCEHHLDWIEVWAVGREEADLRARLGDALGGLFGLVAGEVVHDHGVASPQLGDKHLLDIGAKAFAVHRPIEDAWRDEPLRGYAGKKCRDFPMAVRRIAKRTLAHIGPGPAARHSRRGPCFVEKDEPPGQFRLSLFPCRARLGHVGPLLLAGVHGFF